MRIIGFNLAKTSYGLPLDNGGACLIEDGEVKMLINEERLNRQQYSAGFILSIEYILKHNNLCVDDIDLFVASRCLDAVPTVKEIREALLEEGYDIPETKLLPAAHHLAHAYSAYFPSGLDEAVVLVMDGDGNTQTETLKNGTNSKEGYWDNQFEHNSYYVARGNELSLFEVDEIHAGENGFGGAYRYFTYFCGFHGYKYAGKLMGLSAYGYKRNKYNDLKIFELTDAGGVKCLLPDTDRNNSPQVVEEFLQTQGITLKPRDPKEGITEEYEDIAYAVQREFDVAIAHKVKYLIEKTGIKNICIAGGVGLNAVTNEYLLKNTDVENLFIQPAAGDSGQCLGNALIGVRSRDPNNLKREPISVYQGASYSSAEIADALAFADDHITYKQMEFEQLASLAARKISEGNIVGWFQDRSEMGPRALGNRSLLANPTMSDMKDIINAHVKHREAFRPFAPSTTFDTAIKYFDIDRELPYMIVNTRVKDPKKLPSITHYDGTARVQTVTKEQNARYYTVIKEVGKLTGADVVINTSFNDNEAIVETPRNAINTFLRTGIDYLFIGDFFVKKKHNYLSRQESFQLIQNEWSEIAASVEVIQKAKEKVINPVLVRLLKENVPAGGKVFDYTAEWGEYIELMQDAGFETSGLNQSDEMVRSAKNKNPDLPIFGKDEFYKNMHLYEQKFDAVISNLWLCITEKERHGDFIKNVRKLTKDDGVMILSFCHPCFDMAQESIVTSRHYQVGVLDYSTEIEHEKVVRENGLEFTDYHRPMEYYTNLFRENNLEIVDIAESDTLGTHLYPDFIFFVLKKKPISK